ncbi:MAG: hypothetical protein RML40_01490 [Bacteroidota bacterium]|nr:hypothetical protein [Candidatus Kapabacteria bacterium]MDW8219181.1 hypothetical protein [Bacteroidota bacterium]
MSKPIYDLINELPQSGPTVLALQALDYIVPGEWQNITGFENMIVAVTGEIDHGMIQQIGERAITLYNDPAEGYQRAVWLYQTANSIGGKLGAAALANKLGESISFLSFLEHLTPKADKLQAIDFVIKVAAEIIAYAKINGIPGDGVAEFMGAVGDYGKESLMRLAALVCFDGIVPLGPDFLRKIEEYIASLVPNDLESNPAFSVVSSMIPGGSIAGQLGFVQQGFQSIKGWIGNFVSSRGITREGVVGSLKQYIDISDDKLDYVAAFLDATTNYFEHTGIQTIGRRLIERAIAEI